MKPEIKEKWVTALRSGDYKQTASVLRDGKGFCCLGVLCDLYLQENEDGELRWGDVIDLSDHENAQKGSLFGTAAFEPPLEVSQWAGLDVANPLITLDCYASDLASLNDSGHTFSEIANFIEAQL
jgi:hypothetical protein